VLLALIPRARLAVRELCYGVGAPLLAHRGGARLAQAPRLVVRSANAAACSRMRWPKRTVDAARLPVAVTPEMVAVAAITELGDSVPPDPAKRNR